MTAVATGVDSARLLAARNAIGAERIDGVLKFGHHIGEPGERRQDPFERVTQFDEPLQSAALGDQLLGIAIIGQQPFEEPLVAEQRRYRAARRSEPVDRS